MRNLAARWILAACLAVGWACSASAADTVLSYRGRLLRPHTGNGVHGVRDLRFSVSGELPAPGTCSKAFTILDVSDGSFSLKKALAMGYAPSKHNHIKICSDAQSGALSESLHVNVALYTGGNLAVAYTWLSSDPRRGGVADSVIEYANIEYHVSEARHIGHLMVDAAR